MNYKITLEGVKASSPVDITDRLLRDGKVMITQEVERGHYERVVSDCSIDLSDMDGTIGNVFAGARNTDRWYLRVVVEGRKIFYGPIRPEDQERGTLSEKIKLQAFSIERSFWDGAALAKCGPRYGLGTGVFPLEYATLQYMLERDLLRQGWITAEAIFSKIDAGDFAAREIHDSLGCPKGRWREIDPQTTWKTFLEQAALYYNCEYYIDVESDTLMIVPRNLAPTTFTNIDAMIVADQEYTVRMVSQDTYDYIYAFSYQNAVDEIPQLKGFPAGPLYRLGAGSVWFKMSAEIPLYSQDKELPAGPSTDAIEVPAPEAAYAWRAVKLQIPPTLEGTVRRHIYMRDIYSAGMYRRVATVEGNVSTEVIIGFGTNWFPDAVAPQVGDTVVNAWHKYDEATGFWSNPILDIGTPDPPSGRIKDVRPQLSFYEVGNKTNVLPYDPSSAFEFFKNDITTAIIREQYKDLFLSRPLVEVKVEGINWRIGDGITSTRVPGLAQSPGRETGKGSFNARIKKAVIDVLDETTILGVVPI